MFCICRTPYDESQFYICCDSCQGWFHGRCVGVLQTEANNIDVYICPDCRVSRTRDTCLESRNHQIFVVLDCLSTGTPKICGISWLSIPFLQIKTGADEESLALLNKPLTKVDLDNLKKLLLAVRNHKQAWPFREPVNRRQAPDYFQVRTADLVCFFLVSVSEQASLHELCHSLTPNFRSMQVIKHPMDLRTVEQNLTASKYTTLQQFVNDMTLIFDNCRYYNSKESTFYSCADLLEAFFVQKMKLYKEALQRRM